MADSRTLSPPAKETSCASPGPADPPARLVLDLMPRRPPASNLYMKASFYMKEHRTSIQAEFHLEVIMSLSSILVLTSLVPLNCLGAHGIPAVTDGSRNRVAQISFLPRGLICSFFIGGNCTCFSGLVATTFFFFLFYRSAPLSCRARPNCKLHTKFIGWGFLVFFCGPEKSLAYLKNHHKKIKWGHQYLVLIFSCLCCLKMHFFLHRYVNYYDTVVVLMTTVGFILPPCRNLIYFMLLRSIITVWTIILVALYSLRSFLFVTV
jgi:hypothetical protein